MGYTCQKDEGPQKEKMKKRMDQLKFMVDLNWRMRFEQLDNIFCNPYLLIELNRFLETETGKKWLNSENGKKYLEWQAN